MKKFWQMSAVIAMLVGFSMNAQAQAKKMKGNANKPSVHDQFSGQGYGVAGCGLGSIVFGPKPGMIQVVASTVNNTFASQTFGITSGTSNCDIAESGQAAAAFIEVNKEIVRKDAARGEGETVSVINDLINCGSVQALGQELRSNYDFYLGSDVNSYETIRRLTLNNTCKPG